MSKHVFFEKKAALASSLSSIADRGYLAAFLLFVIPLGLVLAVITPNGDVPDETAHILRAYALAHGEPVGFRQTDAHGVLNAGIVADPAMVWSSFGAEKPILAADFQAKTRLQWTRRPVFLAINPVAVYFPIFYAPAALGIAIAQAAGLPPYNAFHLARLISFVCFASLGIAALVLARRAQGIIFFTLAVPMTLSLGASCNPDGLLIATTALAVAFITRGARIPAALCIAAVALVKPPYALIALILLLPLPWPLKLPRRRCLLAVLTVLPACLWFAYTMLAVAAPSAHPAYRPGPLWPGNPAAMFHATNPAAQLAVLRAHPMFSLHLVWTSVVTNPWLLRETIGLLGYQSVVLTPMLYNLWMLAAAAAVLSDLFPAATGGVRLPEIPLLAAIIAVSIYLVWISQYLNWTEVGLNRIDGPAGRYLLPLIPLLGLALPRLALSSSIAKPLRGAITLAPILVSFATLLLLPNIMTLEFYLH